MLVNLNTIELDFDYFDADQGPSYIEGAEKIAKICTDMEGKRYQSRKRDVRNAGRDLRRGNRREGHAGQEKPQALH